MGWLGTWAHRLKIVIDKDDIDAALSNFPILLYLSSSSGIASRDITEIFDELGANHLKIAVTLSDGTTQCYVEVEKWDNGNEKAWLWAKVVSISHEADTVLYFYFDSAEDDNTTYVGIPSDAVVHNVWNTDYLFVSHMRDDPDNGHIRDSTVSAFDGAKGGAAQPNVVTTGQIDDAQEFDVEYITLGSPAGLDNLTAFTYMCWVKPTLATSYQMAMSKYDKQLFIRNNGQIRSIVEAGSDHAITYSPTGAVSANTWYFLAMRYDDDGDRKIDLFKNGVPATPYDYEQAADGALDDDSGRNMIIGSRTIAPENNFLGLIDEVIIAGLLSDACIKATYETGRDHLITWNKDFTVLVEDGIDVSDEVSTGFKKLLEDGIDVSDAMTKATSFKKLLEDGIETTDVISKVSAFKKLLLDTANVEDTLAKVTAFKKLLEDTVEVSSDLTIIKIYLVLLEDTIEVSDSLTKVTSFKKLLQDTINTSDELAKTTAFHKILTDTIESISALTTKLTAKPLEDTIEVSSALTKIASFKKTLEDLVEVSDTLTKITSFKKVLTDTIEASDELTKTTAFHKTLSDQVLLIDELVKVSTYHKLLTDQITVEDWLQVRQLIIAATIKLLLARKEYTLTLADKSTLLTLADKLSSLSLADKEAIVKLVNKILKLEE